MVGEGGGGANGGPHIPGYEVLGEIGRGGFGTVYRAMQGSVQRVVALKVLAAAGADDATERRFRSEARAVGALSWHHHVVSLYDAGVSPDGHLYLVMEFLPGGSLGPGVRAGEQMAAHELHRVATQMADALAAAHQAGVLHRDVKPDNILRDRQGEYVLSDFGIASLDDGTKSTTGAYTGTYAFSAPELLRGSRASERSDLYSLGATLHALASGSAPFTSKTDATPAAMVLRILEDPVPELPATIPPAFADLIRSLMAKDPDARPTNAAELQATLAALDVPASAPTPAPEPGAPTSTPAAETVARPTPPTDTDATEVRTDIPIPGAVDATRTPDPAPAQPFEPIDDDGLPSDAATIVRPRPATADVDPTPFETHIGQSTATEMVSEPSTAASSPGASSTPAAPPPGPPPGTIHAAAGPGGPDSPDDPEPVSPPPADDGSTATTRRRGPALAIAAVIIVVALVTIGVIASSKGGEEAGDPPSTKASNATKVIETTTTTSPPKASVAAEIDLGTRPVASPTVAGSTSHPTLWAVRRSADGEPALEIIDPSAPKATRAVKLPIDASSFVELVWGPDGAWLVGTVDSETTLLRLDPSSGKVIGQRSLPFPADTLNWLAAAKTEVWTAGVVAGKPTLVGIDPESFATKATVPLEINTLDDLAATNSEVLVTSNAGGGIPGRDGVLTRYDTRSRVITSSKLAKPHNQLSIERGTAWLGSMSDYGQPGSASRVDTSDGKVQQQVEVSQPVTAIAADQRGGAWMIASGFDESYRDHPADIRVRLLHLDAKRGKDAELVLKGALARVDAVGDQAWVVVSTYDSFTEPASTGGHHRLVLVNLS